MLKYFSSPQTVPLLEIGGQAIGDKAAGFVSLPSLPVSLPYSCGLDNLQWVNHLACTCGGVTEVSSVTVACRKRIVVKEGGISCNQDIPRVVSNDC